MSKPKDNENDDIILLPGDEIRKTYMERPYYVFFCNRCGMQWLTKHYSIESRAMPLLLDAKRAVRVVECPYCKEEVVSTQEVGYDEYLARYKDLRYGVKGDKT